MQGNYLEMLPALLRDRSDSAVTVVFQTLSTIYLPIEDRLRLRAIVERAGADGPLVWISTPTPEEHGERRGNYPVEIAIWPIMPKARIIARMSNSGDWLEWSG